MSAKQDRQGVRTFNELARRYGFEKTFAEIMGVALDAQKAVEKNSDEMKTELALRIRRDENNQIVSMLNASANVITLRGNRVSIKSDNFELTENGTITAMAGKIGDCEIIGGKLVVGKGNIPQNVATKDEIPTESKITTIVEGVVTTDYVNALGIDVYSAQIKDRLTADKIDVTGLITAGGLVIGDDLPTKVSDLDNDLNYEDYDGVVTIIDGRITADYIESLEISSTYLKSRIGKIAEFTLKDNYLYSQTDASLSGMYGGKVDSSIAISGNHKSLVNNNYSSARFFAGAPNLYDLDKSKFLVLNDGSLYSTACKIENGIFNNCTIEENCNIKGTITSKNICAQTGTETKGFFRFYEEERLNHTAAYYVMELTGFDEERIAAITLEAQLAESIATIEATYGYLNGTWYYGGSEVATKADLEALASRLGV